MYPSECTLDARLYCQSMSVGKYFNLTFIYLGSCIDVFRNIAFKSMDTNCASLCALDIMLFRITLVSVKSVAGEPVSL